MMLPRLAIIAMAEVDAGMERKSRTEVCGLFAPGIPLPVTGPAPVVSAVRIAGDDLFMFTGGFWRPRD